MEAISLTYYMLMLTKIRKNLLGEKSLKDDKTLTQFYKAKILNKEAHKYNLEEVHGGSQKQIHDGDFSIHVRCANDNIEHIQNNTKMMKS